MLALKIKSMKKILILIFLFCPLLLSAQPSLGDGSFGNPYRGTLTSNWTFSGDKYFGCLDVQSGTFTISAGSFLRFATGDTLSITSTGVISAVGNISSKITFTASGTSWGHIYIISSSATTSEIKYCLIEKGDVSSLTGHTYGGGIRIGSNKVLIENCEFKNNKSTHGGGIFVDKAINPTINNCYIHNNTATASGGGTYFWTDSYSNVSNCLITYNTAGSGGGGGIFLGGKAKNVTIFNSVISHNSASSQIYGHNIRFNNNTNSPKPKFVNSIIWYPANSIVYLSGGSALSTDFEYCAIQNPPITYNNCISLNANNNDPPGPNFTNPASSDYSITFISPCRDVGTNSGAPAQDIINNYRVGPTDIGAYENQYSRWAGTSSTAWEAATNWQQNIFPTSVSNVIIPDVLNDPLISSSDVTVGTLITETGGALTVGGSKLLTATTLTNKGSIDFLPAAKGTFTTIINSGSFKLETDASDVSSLIFANFSGSNLTHELYLSGGEYGTPGSKTYKWHYISSPVTSIDTAVFTLKTKNLAQFVESRPTTGLIQGWVNMRGYVYSTGVYDGPTFGALTPGKGYDYYYSSDWEYTFSGQPNSGSTPTSVTLHYSGTNDNLYGYNLVGNPYPSGIDWDYITATGHGYPVNTSTAVYFTSNNSWITYQNGVSIPSGAATSIIPPMQGFFLKTFADNTTFTIPLAARTHNNIHSRYKGADKGSETIPLVRLATTENGVTDEAVVRFDELAKSGLDYDFDALKLFVSTTSTQIYSSLSGTNYAINGQPFPEATIEIPVVVNFLTSGTHSISATQIQGLEIDSVKLKDTYTGLTTDLKTNPVVTFSAAKGTLSDRFVLLISDITTGVEDNPVVSVKPFNIYPAFSSVNIQTLSDEWDGKSGSVRIIDMTGRIISDLQNIEFNKNSVTSVPAPSAYGLYIVEIRSGINRYVGKIIVR